MKPLLELAARWEKEAAAYSAQAGIKEGSTPQDVTPEQLAHLYAADTFRGCAKELREALETKWDADIARDCESGAIERLTTGLPNTSKIIAAVPMAVAQELAHLVERTFSGRYTSEAERYPALAKFLGVGGAE